MGNRVCHAQDGNYADHRCVGTLAVRSRKRAYACTLPSTLGRRDIWVRTPMARGVAGDPIDVGNCVNGRTNAARRAVVLLDATGDLFSSARGPSTFRCQVPGCPRSSPARVSHFHDCNLFGHCRSVHHASAVTRIRSNPFGPRSGASLSFLLHQRDALRVLRRDLEASCLLTAPSNLCSEEPLMAFRVFCAISTLAERCIPDFLNDLCSRFFCTHEVGVDISNADEEALRRLPQLSRVPVLRAWAAHHHQIFT